MSLMQCYEFLQQNYFDLILNVDLHCYLQYTVKPKFIQTPSTFLTLSQFIRYSCSLENSNKIWQELRVQLCQNKFILIMPSFVRLSHKWISCSI